MKITKVSRSYANAPIIEALIDFKVIPNDQFNMDCLKKLSDTLIHLFPIITNIYEFKAELNIDDNSNNVSRKIIGIRLESEDKNFVLQLTERGFTFSIINTYDTWEEFKKQANTYWKIYLKECNPNKVIREAVRYINRIDIPVVSEKIQIEDYFTIFPNIFENNTAQISGLLMQVQIPQKDHGGLAIVTLSSISPVKPLHASFILDIDVFDLKHLECDSIELWNRVDILRDQKNIIFESSIKNSVRELIQ